MLLLLSVIYMAVAMVMTKDSNSGFKISASKPKISGSALISQFQTDRSTLKRREKKEGYTWYGHFRYHTRSLRLCLNVVFAKGSQSEESW